MFLVANNQIKMCQLIPSKIGNLLPYTKLETERLLASKYLYLLSALWLRPYCSSFESLQMSDFLSVDISETTLSGKKDKPLLIWFNIGTNPFYRTINWIGFICFQKDLIRKILTNFQINVKVLLRITIAILCRTFVATMVC